MAWLRRKAAEVLGALGVKTALWNIHIVNDDAMAALHEQTMGLPDTTDVLTFDMRDEQRAAEEGEAVELETVICADEAERRAQELGHPVRHELLLYCVHSLLHVQGHDDVTAAKSRRMHAREDELLVTLGVGTVYGSAESAGGISGARNGGQNGGRAARKVPRRAALREKQR